MNRRVWLISPFMKFDFSLQSSLLLIFFVHIIVYAFMLWRRALKQESTSDKLLGTFLFIAALFVVPWMTGFAGWYIPNTVYREILFYTPFVHGLLIGPLLYLYVKAITNFHYRLQGKDWLHFIPGVLYIIWSIIVVLVDKLIVKKYYLMDGYSDPDFDLWYQVLQKISIVVYLIASVIYYRQYRKYVNYEMSFADAANINWLRNFLIAFGIITVLPVVQDILELFPFFRNQIVYVRSWYYFMGFALVVYYIAINGFNAVSIPLRKLLFEPELLLQYQQPALLPEPAQPLIQDAEFEIVGNQLKEDATIKQWKAKIISLMENEKLFEDAELTLTQLSKKLSTNPSVLSKVINQGFEMNFNDFVNSYRINAITQMLKAGEQKNQTLLGIAYDCGFNSKATFNRAFKKQTGLSPKEWLMKQNL
jgi:AraC-like DNA-binding protein